jgi:UPF0716 protein FxsA
MIRFWPVLFFVIPVVEVYFLVQVGSAIGAGWTILLVIMTAIFGVNLLRQQGIQTMMKANRAMARGEMPAMEMMEGFLLAIGAVCLITPGFFTDALGFVFLLPLSRKGIIRYLLLNSTIQTAYTVHTENNRREDSKTIEGEFHRDD